MLPDERAGIGGIVAAAARRGRVMALVEAAAWGGAVAALWPVLGVFAAAAVAAWRWRATRREAIVPALERAQPAARNLFITADELERDALGAKPAIRERVLADAAAVARSVAPRDLFPAAPIARAVAAVVVAWAVATAVPWWRAAGNHGAVILDRTNGLSNERRAGVAARDRRGPATAVHRAGADDAGRSGTDSGGRRRDGGGHDRINFAPASASSRTGRFARWSRAADRSAVASR